MDPDCFRLADAQFAKIIPQRPTNTGSVAGVDDRRMISGIPQVLKSGGRWSDGPDIYRPRATPYGRFVHWTAKRVWTKLFQAPAQAGSGRSRAGGHLRCEGSSLGSRRQRRSRAKRSSARVAAT